MNATSTPIAVIGATGRQGGAVVAALLDRGAPVRAIVRDAGKLGDLAKRGVDVTVADLDDGEALRRAFDGVAAVFAMTTMTGPSGTDGEIAHGRAIADAARGAGVAHLVYSSVGGAERNTRIPHFESKWRVEQYLREVGVPTVVVRPTFFMDNFLGLFGPTIENGQVVVRAPLAPGVPLQMIAAEDIGRAAATALLSPSAIPGDAIEIAGDERSPEAIADTFGAEHGLPARFEPTPIDAIGNADAEAMFRWLTELPAYTADFDGTRTLVGDITDLPTFATRHPINAR